jgi:hypothetical protein
VIVREIPTKSGDIYLVPGDIHFDQQDNDALALTLYVASAFRANGVVLVGDTFESTGISRHGRPARSFRYGRGTIERERAAAEPWLDAFKKLVRGRRKVGGLHVLTGNHEHWWRGLQDDYPGFLDTPWHEVYGDLFNGWHVHAEHTALKFGPLLICHGHRLRGALARSSAASVLANYPGQNTLYGHTHRVDSCITPSRKYGSPVRHGAWTIGHLKDPEIEAKDPVLSTFSERHLQGFALVHFWEVEGELKFHVEQVTLDRGISGKPYCIVGGQLYEL